MHLELGCRNLRANHGHCESSNYRGLEHGLLKCVHEGINDQMVRSV